MVNHRKNAIRHTAEKFRSADMRCQLVRRDLLDLLLFLWAQQLLGFGILPGQIPYIVEIPHPVCRHIPEPDLIALCIAQPGQRVEHCVLLPLFSLPMPYYTEY